MCHLVFLVAPALARRLEQVFDSFSSALEYFASAFHGADSDVLAGACRAFAQVSGGVDGMKRY